MSTEHDPQLMDMNDGGADEQTPKTMSLLSGVAGPEGLPDAADADFAAADRGSGNALLQGSLIIVVVAVIAAGGIYVMRLSNGGVSMDAQAQAVEAKIEQALAKLTRPDAMASSDPLRAQNLDSLFADTESAVQFLESDRTKQQVPIDEVQKNPFVLFRTAKADADANPANADRDRELAERERLESLRKLKNELKNLRLESVMGGSQPIAIISGEMLSTGMPIGSFVVKAIEGTQVTLTAGDKEFVLKMDNESQSQNNRLFNR